MKKTSQSHHSTLNELNITPLLDLAFVLLVIFIITTPQLVNNLEMSLPSAQVPPPTEKKPSPPAQIVVRANGDVILNGRPQTLQQLKSSLATLRDADPEFSLVVRGSREADYQHVIGVLDVIQQLGITRMGLATETASATP
jgi:biopolymer transport protein ExbD